MSDALKGKIYCIEGVDGCGKTTLMNKLKKKYGDKVYYFRDPGSTVAGDKIRDILLDSNTKTTDFTDILLYTAARCELYSQNIKELIDMGRIVVMDRFLPSTMVYQTMKSLFNNELDEVKRIQDLIYNLNSQFVDPELIHVCFIKEDPKVIRDRLMGREVLDKRENVDISTINIMQNMYEYTLNTYFKGRFCVTSCSDNFKACVSYLDDLITEIDTNKGLNFNGDYDFTIC